MIKIFGLSLGNNFPSLKTNKTNLNKSVPNFFVNSTNLKPLASDTISFTSRKKQKEKPSDKLGALPVQSSIRDANDKVMHEKERTITNVLAHRISREASYDTKRLEITLKQSLDSLMPENNKSCDREHPIYNLEFRTKGANSIREKATQKYLFSKEAVINRLGDIIGARIILGDNSKNSADLIVDELIEIVKEGRLKITEVENHTPYDKKFQYVGQTKLHKLAQASSDRFGIFVNEKSVRNETGYTAVHLSVVFPDGYRGEIQILGRDVAVLKELEDIPYKILQGKSVNPQYHKIVSILEPLCPISDNPNDPENIKRAKLKKEFIAYTAAAYKYERNKVNLNKRRDLIPYFLTLGEFAQSQRRKIHLPLDMDFNNLYRLKTSADYKIKQSSN